MTYSASNKADFQNETLCRLLSVNHYYCISIYLLHKETLLLRSLLEWHQLKELYVRHRMRIKYFKFVLPSLTILVCICFFFIFSGFLQFWNAILYVAKITWLKPSQIVTIIKQVQELLTRGNDVRSEPENREKRKNIYICLSSLRTQRLISVNMPPPQ